MKTLIEYRGAAAALSTLALVACGVSAEDGRNPMGSQAMVTSQDYSAIYVASPDDEVVARVDAESMNVQITPVPGEPTRIARVGGRLLVTQRAQRRVLELIEQDGQLQTGRTLELGAEPYGIVASEDGLRVYVAESQSGRVIELEAGSLEIIRAWNLPGEPRWLALHPGGESLYVAGSAPGATNLVRVDLGSGASEVVELPTVETFDFRKDRPIALTPRITGDPAASPDGKYVAVPMLYVDNENLLAEPGGEPDPVSEGGYGGRMNPAVVLIETKGDGSPKARPNPPVLVSSFEASSYPTSVTFSPDADLVVTTLEGASSVAVFETRPSDGDFFDFGGSSSDVGAPPGAFNFDARPVLFVQVPAGPRAVAFTSKDRGFVYGFLDRQVAPIPLSELRDQVRFGGGGFFAFTGTQIVQSNLPPEVEEGRRLFYATNDARVSQSGGGVSCATCHFEGRDDGITWNFARGPRQTPSLAGMVSLREPVRWEGDKATVADDAFSTSQGLMGGTGLTMSAAQTMAAFIDYTRAVDHEMLGADDDGVRRGREIFEREDVACASCHSGAIYSDKQTYSLFSVAALKTPSLLGIAATAPYLHNGSAPDLRAVLDAARSGVMGDTSSLTEAEMQDLEAFLRSL